MNPEIAERNEHQLLGSPWMFLLLMFGILAARWIWIAVGGTEFGWTYEPAWRILHGQVPYRDFVFVPPPLAPYTLAALMKIFGESLWAFQLCLYLSWIGSMAVGIAILGVLGASRRIRVLSVVVAGTFSAPFTAFPHPHSYQGCLFGGLVIYFLLKYRRSRRVRNIFWAGLLGGVGVVARQNIGLLFGMVAAVTLLFSQPPGLSIKGKRLTNLSFFLAGGGLGLFPILGYFFYEAGFQEPIRELFLDAGAGKGGPVTIFLRGVPRFPIDPTLPHARTLEGLIAMTVFAVLCYLTYNACDRESRHLELRKENGGNEPSVQNGSGYSPWHYGYFFVIAGVVFVATLLDLPRVRLVQQVCRVPVFHAYNWDEMGLLGGYMITCSSAAACALRIYRKRANLELALPCVLFAALAYTNATSDISYFGFVAPVVVPILIYVLHAVGLPNMFRSGVAISTAFLIAASFFPTWAKTFCPLYALPRGSPFSGLYADSHYYQAVTEVWQSVAPRIRGQRTLWLIPGGPLSAYGGLPVPNVVYLHGQSYNSRSERNLWDDWHRDPPRYVLFGDFARANGTVLFREDSLTSWLSSGYEIVWQRRDPALTLWKKREKPRCP